MARYIDADKLIEVLKEHKNYYAPNLSKITNEAMSCALSLAIREVKNTPTADVAKVKHGKWIDRYSEKYDNHLYECSECRKKALYEVGSDELGNKKITQALTPACPYCFAKMDE